MTGVSKRLSYLRKERGLTQRQAAEALGVSQALLSHYERGIRVCGLEFVVRAAQYYEVTCDYLLGCTMQKQGEQPLEAEQALPENRLRGSVSVAMGKKLLSGAVGALLELCEGAKNQELIKQCTNALYVDIYRLFRLFYAASGGPEGQLVLPEAQVQAAVDMQRASALMKVEALLAGRPWPGYKGACPESGFLEPLTNERIQQFGPAQAQALLHVLNQADALCRKSF